MTNDTRTHEPPAVDRLLSAREVAEYLGVHIKTLYKFIGRGGAKRRPRYENDPGYQSLPCTYVGGRLRFRLSDVTSWIRQRKEE